MIETVARSERVALTIADAVLRVVSCLEKLAAMWTRECDSRFGRESGMNKGLYTESNQLAIMNESDREWKKGGGRKGSPSEVDYLSLLKISTILSLLRVHLDEPEFRVPPDSSSTL